MKSVGSLNGKDEQSFGEFVIRQIVGGLLRDHIRKKSFIIIVLSLFTHIQRHK